MKFRELRKLLREHDVKEDSVKGKGSHRAFRRGDTWYTVPFHGDNEDVKMPYIRELEKLFGVDLQGKAKASRPEAREPAPETDAKPPAPDEEQVSDTISAVPDTPA